MSATIDRNFRPVKEAKTRTKLSRRTKKVCSKIYTWTYYFNYLWKYQHHSFENKQYFNSSSENYFGSIESSSWHDGGRLSSSKKLAQGDQRGFLDRAFENAAAIDEEPVL